MLYFYALNIEVIFHGDIEKRRKILKLEINDLSLLKITKLKRWWNIYFEYDNQKYLLHERSESGEGSDVILYKRIPLNDKGKYNLEYVASKGYISIDNLLKEKHKKIIVYNQIDKEYFVKHLTHYDFCSGIYKDEVDTIHKKNNIRQEQIKRLNGYIREIQRKINNLEH